MKRTIYDLQQAKNEIKGLEKRLANENKLTNRKQEELDIIKIESTNLNLEVQRARRKILEQENQLVKQ